MIKKLLCTSLSLLFLFALAIPAYASPKTLSFHDLTIDQQATYNEYLTKGYDVSISQNEEGLVVISGSKKLSKAITILAEIEDVTFIVDQSVYLGNYKVATVEGSLTAKITNYSSATITSYPLHLKHTAFILDAPSQHQRIITRQEADMLN